MYLAFSPVPVTISGGSFGSNSVLRYYEVTLDGKYTMHIDANDSPSITIDVGNVARGQLVSGFNIVNAALGATSPVQVSVSAKAVSLLPNGTTQTSAASVSPSSVSVYLGQFTEMEMANGAVSSISAPMSTQPKEDYYIVGEKTPTAIVNDNEPDWYVLDSTGVRYVYLKFLNHLGFVETVYARTLYAESVDGKTEQFSRLSRLSGSASFSAASALPSVYSAPHTAYRSFAMSSGAVTAPWARWWAMEFLRARFAAVMMNGKWVPCVIKPKSDSMSIVDYSRTEPSHIDFTIVLGYGG